MAQERAKEPAEPLESEDVVAEKHRYREGKPNERYYDHRDGDGKRPKQIHSGLLRRRVDRVEFLSCCSSFLMVSSTMLPPKRLQTPLPRGTGKVG